MKKNAFCLITDLLEWEYLPDTSNTSKPPNRTGSYTNEHDPKFNIDSDYLNVVVVDTIPNFKVINSKGRNIIYYLGKDKLYYAVVKEKESVEFQEADSIIDFLGML